MKKKAPRFQTNQGAFFEKTVYGTYFKTTEYKGRLKTKTIIERHTISL